MLYFTSLAIFFLCTLSFFCSCQKKESLLKESPPPEKTRLTDKPASPLPFFTPQAGDEWIYQGTHTYANGKQAPPWKKIVRCLGEQAHPRGIPQCMRFDHFEHGKKTESEFLIINNHGIYSAGHKPSLSPSIQWLETPFPLLLTASQAGSQWQGSEHPDHAIKFRYLAQESLTVPAGTFRVIHLQMIEERPDALKHHDLWIAPKVGIVKEQIWIGKQGASPQKRVFKLLRYSSL